MNFDKLIPFIKKALEHTTNVTPAEIQAVLQEQENNEGDQNTETVDSDILDKSPSTTEEVKNEEGKLLEHAFKELEVEEAIKTVEERKKMASVNEGAGLSYWEQLNLYINGNNRR